jgi:hypothetical protein
LAQDVPLTEGLGLADAATGLRDRQERLDKGDLLARLLDLPPERPLEAGLSCSSLGLETSLVCGWATAATPICITLGLAICIAELNPKALRLG